MQKLARSDAQLLANGLLAECFDVENLTPQGRQDWNTAISRLLDLAAPRGVEIVPDADTGTKEN